MGLLIYKKYAIAQRQNADPVAAPTATGIFGDGTLSADPNQATAAPTLAFDTGAPAGGGFTTAPQLASSHIPVITTTPTDTPTPTPSSESTDASATIEASSSSSRPISMSTVVGSCVGAFIGAVALICLALWFYRRYQRSLKATYARNPNNRADAERRLSHREPWGKLEDSNPEDKWEGRPKQSSAEESVAPMEKLTMFKKSNSVRTAYTHTEEEPVHFEISHPFAQQYPLHNMSQTNPNDRNDHASIPMPKPLTGHDTSSHAISWDDATQGSFMSVRTHSGPISPSVNMAIPTPPATSSPLHHWESAEIINFDGQSAEIVNPFGDDNKPEERRKSSGNPFFGAQEDVPRRRSRSNSLASRTSRAQSEATSSIYIPVPRLDKGKGRAIDPFNDDHAAVPPSPQIPRPLPTIITSLPTTASPSSPLPPPRPQFATHVASLSGSSSSSNERALASLLAALDNDTTEEEVQARLRIASMQPSINSTNSMYSEGDEDVTKEFPLPPSTPGQSTPTVESFFTAESDRTVRT
ncbi:hypothetical protein P691DRAFT_658408 [Macrolepiota fuliginosa MF-IS2]|uniref:Uncharacterized protein n=1 Tax=Macrolepiota fuliginosa MF-IS2 TaxID=1400762 RepID=A0A9P5XPM1_9AGAR|nr:hypothetical protein P691DRAFT_658408 [Macrolepiota fuliginosa MF-IS2]